MQYRINFFYSIGNFKAGIYIIREIIIFHRV
jgi:hypothetical protein